MPTRRSTLPPYPDVPGEGYRSPHTSHGVHLSGLARAGAASVVVHEAGYLPRGLRWHFPGVRSPFWRLYYNHDPGSEVRSGGRAFPIGPGRPLIVPEDVLFDCVGEAGTSHLWLHFAVVGSGLARAFSGPTYVPFGRAVDAAMEALVGAHGKPEGALRTQRLYHAAASLLHACFAALEVPLSQTAPERLDEVLAQIENASASDLSNPVLAARAGMSVETFIRWFKQHTGLTPAVFVARSRVRRAAQLLVLTDRSIDEIAGDTGFADRFHFTRVFRKQMGSAPAEFRKRHVGV